MAGGRLSEVLLSAHKSLRRENLEPAEGATPRPRVSRRRVTVAQAIAVLATFPSDAVVTSFTVDLLADREAE